MKLLTGADDLVGVWVSSRAGGRWYAGMGVGIGVLGKTGSLIAAVSYYGYNTATIWADIAAEPGSRWATRGVLRALFHYPFNQLKVKALRCKVASTNQASRSLVSRLGFHLETQLDSAEPGGDLLIYRMRKPECCWLEVGHGKIEQYSRVA